MQYLISRLVSGIATGLLFLAVVFLFAAIPMLLLAIGISGAILEPDRLLSPPFWLMLVFFGAMFSFAIWIAKVILSSKTNVIFGRKTTFGIACVVALSAFAASPWWEQAVLISIVSGGGCFAVGLILCEVAETIAPGQET